MAKEFLEEPDCLCLLNPSLIQGFLLSSQDTTCQTNYMLSSRYLSELIYFLSSWQHFRQIITLSLKAFNWGTECLFPLSCLLSLLVLFHLPSFPGLLILIVFGIGFRSLLFVPAYLLLRLTTIGERGAGRERQ